MELRGTPIKEKWALVARLWGVNYRFWSPLRFRGRKAKVYPYMQGLPRVPCKETSIKFKNQTSP